MQPDPDRAADVPTPAAGEAPTLSPTPDPNARTVLADLHGSPAATVPAALDRTRPTERDRATAPAPGSGAFATGGSQSGAYRTGTGTLTRTLRTRINLELPADAQQLDEKLQLSRPSVLVDMSSARGDVLPPGLRRLIEQQGTEGRYAIQRPIAAGGMGAVLAIHDNDFRRQAAMKVILGRHADAPEAIERFLAEAQVTAQLEHPNIVPIHDLGVMADGTLYFTMKLIEGQSLGTVIKGLRAEDPALLARWTVDHRLLTFLKVLDGVGFAHSRGVVHRDLKPDNIMLGAHGEVLVVDWGIAKVLGEAETPAQASSPRPVVSVREGESASQTLTGAAMGTIFYMPPEQAAGRLDQVDQRSDVYALGATLYHLLSLKRPLEPGAPAAMIAKTITGDVIPLQRQLPDVATDLAAVVGKAMALAREDRYPSCEAFADDLRRFLAGQAVRARRRNLVERVGAWIAAHRRQVQFAAATAALIALGAGGAVWIERGRTRARIASLVAAAADDYRAGAESLDPAPLERSWTAVLEASGLAPADAAVADLKQQVFAARDAAARKQADAQRAQAAAARARELADEAEARRASGDVDGAASAIQSAFELAPLDPGVVAARDAIQRLVADRRRRDAVARADAHQRDGEARLAEARALPLDDPRLVDALAAARDALTLATKQDVEPPARVGPLIAETAALAQKAEDARAAKARLAVDRKAHEEGLADATRLADAGDWTRAREAVAAALKRVPDSEPALALRDRVIAGERDAAATRERDARLASARTEAQSALARARAGMQALAAGDARLAGLDADIARLERQPGADAKRLDARKAAQDERRALAERWSLSEGDAQSALGLLGEEPSHPLAAESRRILADLYARRLGEARALRAQADVLAFTNLLKRYDSEERYLRELSDTGTLVVQGAAGAKIELRPVIAGPDTRLVAGDVARALTPSPDPLTLPKGRWQLDDGTVRITVQVEAGKEALVAWPEGLPRIAAPAIALRYVPGDGARKPFLLGESEITHDQYLAFISDPKVFAAVAAGLESEVESPLVYIPRTAATAGEAWQLWKDDAGRIARIKPHEYQVGRPVNGITRADALGFCEWLSRSSGLKVRLPTLAEWRFAATGGDRDRVWPWGDVFDQAFVVSAATAADQTAPVDQVRLDVGPFGHRGLAGNVREFVADRIAEGDRERAVVAGGSFADRAPAQFAADAVDLIQADAMFSAIGFRILVELP